MNFPLIANVVVFVVLLLLLAQTRHKQWSLAKKVLVGLAMGVVFGLALQAIYGSDNPVLKDSIQWFNIVGNGYVQLLQMIVMPLVFASILSAVARLHNATQLGKISFLTIGTLLFTTLIAALVGVLVTNLFGLTAEGLVQGTAETARLTAIQTNYVGKVADLTVPQTDRVATSGTLRGVLWAGAYQQIWKDTFYQLLYIAPDYADGTDSASSYEFVFDADTMQSQLDEALAG